MPVYEFIVPVRCRYVEGRRVALPGDRATLTTEQAEPIAAFLKMIEGEPSEPPTVEHTKGEDARLNLNTATEAQITAIRYIGKATAKKLIEARPFESLDAALAASGLTEAQCAEIAPSLTV